MIAVEGDFNHVDESAERDGTHEGKMRIPALFEDKAQDNESIEYNGQEDEETEQREEVSGDCATGDLDMIAVEGDFNHVDESAERDGTHEGKMRIPALFEDKAQDNESIEYNGQENIEGFEENVRENNEEEECEELEGDLVTGDVDTNVVVCDLNHDVRSQQVDAGVGAHEVEKTSEVCLENAKSSLMETTAEDEKVREKDKGEEGEEEEEHQEPRGDRSTEGVDMTAAKRDSNQDVKCVADGVEENGTHEQKVLALALIETNPAVSRGEGKDHEGNEDEMHEELEADRATGDVDMDAMECDLSHDIESRSLDAGTEKDGAHEAETAPARESTPLVEGKAENEKVRGEEKDEDCEGEEDDEFQDGCAPGDIGMTAMECDNHDLERDYVDGDEDGAHGDEKTPHLCHEGVNSCSIVDMVETGKLMDEDKDETDDDQPQGEMVALDCDRTQEAHDVEKMPLSCHEIVPDQENRNACDKREVPKEDDEDEDEDEEDEEEEDEEEEDEDEEAEDEAAEAEEEEESSFCMSEDSRSDGSSSDDESDSSSHPVRRKPASVVLPALTGDASQDVALTEAEVRRLHEEDDLELLTVPVLRSLCARLGFTGISNLKKSCLVSRLTTRCCGVADEGGVVDGNGCDGQDTADMAHGSQGTPQRAFSPERSPTNLADIMRIHEEGKLDTLTKSQLQVYCRHLKLPVTAKRKQDLVERIQKKGEPPSNNIPSAVAEQNTEHTESDAVTDDVMIDSPTESTPYDVLGTEGASAEHVDQTGTSGNHGASGGILPIEEDGAKFRMTSLESPPSVNEASGMQKAAEVTQGPAESRPGPGADESMQIDAPASPKLNPPKKRRRLVAASKRQSS